MNRRVEKLLAGLLMGLVIFSVSCSKKDKIGSGQIMIVNTSPAFGPVDVVVDTKAFTTSPLSYPGNTPYTPILEGSHEIKVLQAGSTTELVNIKLTTVANKNQSLYFFDRPSSLQLFAVEDNYSSPGTGQSNIRFFNLGPGSTLLDLGTLAGAVFTPVFTSRSFETTTNVATHATFSTIPSGTYNFDLRVSGAGTSIASKNSVVLESGKTYTIYSRGISGSGTTPLGLQIIEH